MMTPEGLESAGNNVAQFNDLDACIYQLVEVQAINTPELFVIAGCIETDEPSAEQQHVN